MPLPSKPELQPHEAELARKAELLRKVKVMRDGLIQSQATIEGKKKDKIYTWVNRHDSRVVQYQGMGYSICKDPDVKTRWKQADNTHVRGDVILMECPADLHEAWRSLAEQSALEALEGSKESFRDFAGSHGVPVFDPRP